MGVGRVVIQPSGEAELPSSRRAGSSPALGGRARRSKTLVLLGQEIQPRSREFLPFDGALIPPLWGTPVLGPRQGRYLLIVIPIVRKKRLTKVLMDGGSGLNILYVDTLDAMHIARSKLRLAGSPFHGVILGA